MTYPWPTLMLMGIVVISRVRPSVQPSMGLGLCIAYKALGRNGLQFGMLMYPDGLHSAFNTLVDTGDICCHYWQHILVFKCNSIINILNISHYFLRYYLIMQHQLVVKRVNGANEWAHRPYQLLSALYHCWLYKHRGQDERQPPQSSWPVPICT